MNGVSEVQAFVGHTEFLPLVDVSGCVEAKFAELCARVVVESGLYGDFISVQRVVDVAAMTAVGM